ncbi:hypothetical protein QTP86_028528, partial [Hemibagrus guttatus]
MESENKQSQGDMTKDTEDSAQLANSQNTEECEGTDVTIDDSGFTAVRSKRKLKVGSGGSQSRKKGLVETEKEKQITTGKKTETEPSSDPETNVDTDSDEDQEIVNKKTGTRQDLVQEDLYRCEHRDSKELLDTFYQGLPKVSSEDNTALEGPLVLEEMQVVLNTMPGGKAPGIDGLPVEFYKFFWKELGEDLLEVLEESCRERRLPLSSRRAVITLLPKKGDLQDINNWCPVSLLCTDYKVMSKALANRLRDIMDSVIQTDQTYCVPNRSIIDNVSLIRDILDVSRSLAVDLGLISLDQEKAFGRVEHQYLWKTLEAFGLSPSLIAMMKVLYQDVESVLKINGGLSAPFKVQRGIRQGCSLSAWTLFKRGSQGPAVSLYWLLEEPLVGGGHLDIKDSSPGLTHITQSEKFTTLKRLVDTAGPEFKDTRAVAEELSLRPLRYTEDIIQRWTNKLSEDKLNLIKEYHDGTETPDKGNPFPELELLPDLNGYEG